MSSNLGQRADNRSCGAGEERSGVFKAADGCQVTGRLDEVTGSLDLWTHRPGGELKATEFFDRGISNLMSRRRSPADLDGGDIGEEEEGVGGDELGEQRSGAVLVDDGLYPAESSLVVADDGDPTAAGTDNPDSRCSITGSSTS